MNWIASEGIILETSAPYTPAQNGTAERSGGVIINRAREMRLQSNLPANLWLELVCTDARLLNRSPVKQLNWRTLIEVL